MPPLPISSKGIEAWLSRIRVAILCRRSEIASAWASSSKAAGERECMDAATTVFCRLLYLVPL